MHVHGTPMRCLSLGLLRIVLCVPSIALGDHGKCDCIALRPNEIQQVVRFVSLSILRPPFSVAQDVIVSLGRIDGSSIGPLPYPSVHSPVPTHPAPLRRCRLGGP